MKWIDAIAIAEKGFDAWAEKEHNAKWVRRIDGTPIKNDLLVNIATAFAEMPGPSHRSLAYTDALAMDLWSKLCTDCVHVLEPEKCDCLDDILEAFNEVVSITATSPVKALEIKSQAQIEVDRQPYNQGFRDGWELAHERASCGHARANWKDPKFWTAEYQGQEECEFCAALTATSPAEATPLKTLADKISAKIKQIEHYVLHDAQLAHARTIAEGRIQQANQILHWIDELTQATGGENG